MLKNSPILKKLSSLKITIACLFLLFVLTFWGTLYQVENGIYYSQERFFNSFYFLVNGFCPFPGARLVIWILFINLLAVTITRFIHYKWKKNLGILIIHFGLLTYFFGAFVTFHLTEETYLNLREGVGSNLSESYRDWEIALWTEQGEERTIAAIDTRNFTKDYRVKFKSHPIEIVVDTYYPHTQAYLQPKGEVLSKWRNGSNIGSLTKMKMEKEPEKNIAGGTFVFRYTGDDSETNSSSVSVLLYGLEKSPTELTFNDQKYFIKLRKRRTLLPMTVVLDDFIREMHPGTEVAKSFKSWVTINPNNIVRKALIYMNEPLRYKDFTFYQASYAFDRLGREYSTFAVVKNPGRLLPYISSLLVFAGLMIHFMGYAVKKR